MSIIVENELRTCIQCGTCTAGCVAAGGMQTSPRKLWRTLQMGAGPEAMDSMSYWSCTTCGLCDKRCPRGIPLSKIVLSLRERRHREGGRIAGVDKTAENLAVSRNITGDEAGNRFLWIENLVLPEAERAKLFREKSETVYFTGCVGALFPQVGGIPQSLTRLLLKYDADFSLLDDEWCCGYPIMAGGMGLEGVKEYALHNIAAIEAKGAKTVVVACPTCYYMFDHIYPDLYGGPLPFQTQHYTEYLDRFGPLPSGGRDAVATYHDPCDLGRKLHITEAPRKLIGSLAGVTFREMRFSGEESKCCGGGGNLEMANPDLSLDIAIKRVNDAMAVEAEYLLSSCQQCKRTLQQAARKSRARVKVMDLLEFALARMEEAEKEAAI